MSKSIASRDQKGRNTARDLTGFKAGLLTVVEPTGERCKHGYAIWKARCGCGNAVVRPSYRFTRPKIAMKSCGCIPTGRKPLPGGQAHINALYAHNRTGAKARNLEFTISKEVAARIYRSDCVYCGGPPTKRYTHSNLAGSFAHNGIDRIDSAKGYVPGNVVPCCPACNVAKASMSVSEFKAWVRRVYHKFCA